MGNLNLPKNLFNLSCVDEVSQTVVNGATKHYRIRAYSDVPEITSILTTLWPFCEVTIKGGSTVIDFLIRPDEIEGFSARMAKVSPVIERHRLKIMIPMGNAADETLKRKVKSCLRPGDRVVWGNSYLAIVTDSNQAAVRCIRRRMEKLLKMALGDGIAQEDRVV